MFPSTLETFGIVLVEALSFGVPVISSKAGAAEEILDNGRAGLLLDQVSPETVAKAVKRVLEKPSETMARVSRGLALPRQKYSLEANWDRLARLLEG